MVGEGGERLNYLDFIFGTGMFLRIAPSDFDLVWRVWESVYRYRQEVVQVQSQRGERVGALPTFGTRFVHVIVQFDEIHNKALMLTCQREGCGKQFILLDDPGKTRTASCPYCLRTSNHV